MDPFDAPKWQAEQCRPYSTVVPGQSHDKDHSRTVIIIIMFHLSPNETDTVTARRTSPDT